MNYFLEKERGAIDMCSFSVPNKYVYFYFTPAQKNNPN